METVQFPNQGIVDQIKVLPKFNADVSRFINDDAEAVVAWAEGQEGRITLNVANATPEELAKFERVNEILAGKGRVQINLSNEKAVVDGITRQITEEVVSRGREAFRDFILKVLNEEPELLVTEFNQFAAPRGKGYLDVHYWDNIGLGDEDDALRWGNGVDDMFFVALKEIEVGDIHDRLVIALDGKLDDINISPGNAIADIQHKVDVLLVGMLSNMVRGVLYEHSNPGKVDAYRPRRIAVDVINEWVKKGCPRDEVLY